MTRPLAFITAGLCALAAAAAAPLKVTQYTAPVVEVWQKSPAKHCFVQAPSEVIPLLSKNTRLDMVDYFEAGSDRASANELDGPARITALHPALVEYDYGNGMRCQLLAIEEYCDTMVANYVIGLVETLDTPIPDSKITFYDSSWNVLKGVFTPPRLADWLVSKSKEDRELAERVLPFITVVYTFDPSTLALTATPTISQRFDPASDEARTALSLLKPGITYRWDHAKKRYIMTK